MKICIIGAGITGLTTGYKLSKLIKSDDRHQNTKIIIMSNSAGATIDKMFKQSNADIMIEKPFQLKDILKIIKEDTSND